MSDHRINVKFDSEGQPTVVRQIEEIGKSATNLINPLTTAKDMLGQVFKTIVESASVVEIIDNIRRSIMSTIGYMSKIETSITGIAASYMTGGKYIDSVTGSVLSGTARVKAAIADAGETVSRLKVRNYETIATLDQLVRAYQETLPIAQRVGFNRKQVEDFTVAVTQAAGAVDTTGRLMFGLGEEVRALLMGTIRNGQSRIAINLGLRPEDIKQYQGNAQGLYDFLMEKLQAYVLMGAEVQKTWGGVMSNLKDRLRDWGSIAVQPLFDSFKALATGVINMIGTTSKKTGMFEFSPDALIVAQGLAEGFHKTWLAVVGTVETVYNFLMIFETPLKLICKFIGMVADGWGMILYVLLPPIFEALNSLSGVIKNIAIAIVSMIAAAINSIIQMGSAISSIFSAGVKALSGDIAGARDTLSTLIDPATMAGFTKHVENVKRSFTDIKSTLTGMPNIIEQMSKREEEYNKKLTTKKSTDLLAKFKQGQFDNTDLKEMERLQRLKDRADKYDASQQLRLEEERLKISDAFNKLKTAQLQEQLSVRKAVLDSAYKSFLISDKEYENESYRISSESLASKLKQSTKHLEDVRKGKATVENQLDNMPTSTMIQVEAYNKVRSKYVDFVIKEINAETALQQIKTQIKVLDENHTGKLAELDITTRISYAQAESNLLSAAGNSMAAEALKDSVSLLNIRDKHLKSIQQEINLEKQKASIRQLTNTTDSTAASLVGKNRMGGFTTAKDEFENKSAVAKIGLDQSLEEINRKMDVEQRLRDTQTLSQDAINASIQREVQLREQAILAAKKYNQTIEEAKANVSLSSAIEAGLASYAKSATDLASQTKSVVSSMFKGLEDQLINFVKTGKMSFSDLTTSILSDILRIVIRATILGPIASAMSSAIGSMFSTIPAAAANGAAYDGGIKRFALGGIPDIVNQPTFFGTRSGLGVMGEAGTEAIMPLTRTNDGHLGVRSIGQGVSLTNQEVNVQVNVVNKTSNDVSAKTGEISFDGKKFVIETIIENISNNGELRPLLGR